MDVSAKPVVVVSKCLEFDQCRYNGVKIRSPEVANLKPFLNFVPLCPEMEIGLGVPRDPIRIILQEQSAPAEKSPKKEKRLVQPDTGRDFTGSMKDFLDSFFEKLQVVDGFILKEKSPSCGIRRVKIYPGPGKVPVAFQDSGFFGGAVLERFAHLPLEDEGRLRNARIREHFLTRLYAVSRFRLLKQSPSFSRLVDFQARNKYLFMAYNTTRLRMLGRITANREKKPLPEVLAEYEPHFYKVFAKMPSHTSPVNVLQHALGFVSKKITVEERRFFLGLLRGYREGKQPLSAALGVMKSWILRFGVAYLGQQTFFEPFPEDLMQAPGGLPGK